MLAVMIVDDGTLLRCRRVLVVEGLALQSKLSPSSASLEVDDSSIDDEPSPPLLTSSAMAEAPPFVPSASLVALLVANSKVGLKATPLLKFGGNL